MRFHNGVEELTYHARGQSDLSAAIEESFDRGRWREGLGEYALVEAVLRAAIYEYQKFAGHRTRREARLFREVHQWFLADDGAWDFTFINVCQILDIEPSYIRSGLKLWRERNVQQNGDLDAEDFTARGRGRSQRRLARRSTDTVSG